MPEKSERECKQNNLREHFLTAAFSFCKQKVIAMDAPNFAF